jgi:hypothetical protein
MQFGEIRNEMKICKLKFHLLKHLNLETALPTYQLPVLALETKECNVHYHVFGASSGMNPCGISFMSCPDLISLWNFGSNVDIGSQWNLFFSMQHDFTDSSNLQQFYCTFSAKCSN